MTGTGPVSAPVPARETVWTPVAILPAMKRDAERGPGAVGVKITWTVQAAEGARLAPQLLVWEKSTPLVPPIEIGARPSAAVPVLVMRTDWAGAAVPTVRVAKARLAVDSEGAGRLDFEIASCVTVTGRPATSM